MRTSADSGKQVASVTIKPLGDVGDPKRAAVAARLLGELFEIVGAKTDAVPSSSLLAMTFPDGRMTLLVAERSGHDAGDVLAGVYAALHETVSAYVGEGPPPQAETEGPGPESSDS